MEKIKAARILTEIVTKKRRSPGRPLERDDEAIMYLRSRGLSMRQIAQRLNCSLASVQRSINNSRKKDANG